ncbi:MAG: hypothetical protein OEW87_13430, partial [Flavobacteriaceae bacterium]|nr:hypothetical protein [Flavobacteriaceae bacterium]
MAYQTENKAPGLNTFDHVIVLMLENRSFDNLLGYLYEDGVPDKKKFEGLQDVKIEMPVPHEAKGHDTHKTIAPFEATDYHQPFPDPGEVYQHVNTQLYNHIGEGNCCVKASAMKAPYNIPEIIPPKKLQMLGFVKDYINTLNALTGKKGRKYNQPGFDLYNVIMQCYTPKQIPVLT